MKVTYINDRSDLIVHLLNIQFRFDGCHGLVDIIVQTNIANTEIEISTEAILHLLEKCRIVIVMAQPWRIGVVRVSQKWRWFDVKRVIFSLDHRWSVVRNGRRFLALNLVLGNQMTLNNLKLIWMDE